MTISSISCQRVGSRGSYVAASGFLAAVVLMLCATSDQAEGQTQKKASAPQHSVGEILAWISDTAGWSTVYEQPAPAGSHDTRTTVFETEIHPTAGGPCSLDIHSFYSTSYISTGYLGLASVVSALFDIHASVLLKDIDPSVLVVPSQRNGSPANARPYEVWISTWTRAATIKKEGKIKYEGSDSLASGDTPANSFVDSKMSFFARDKETADRIARALHDAITQCGGRPGPKGDLYPAKANAGPSGPKQTPAAAASCSEMGLAWTTSCNVESGNHPIKCGSGPSSMIYACVSEKAWSSADLRGKILAGCQEAQGNDDFPYKAGFSMDSCHDETEKVHTFTCGFVSGSGGWVTYIGDVDGGVQFIGILQDRASKGSVEQTSPIYAYQLGKGLGIDLYQEQLELSRKRSIACGTYSTN